MSFTRRSFLLGAGSGLSLLLLTACTDDETSPVPTDTATPTPTAVPKPSSVLRSNWSTDSFARGSHSFVAVGGSAASRAALAEPVLSRVFFAGEATSTDHAATILGAQQSGARAAGELSAAADNGERIAVIGAGAAGAEAARLLDLYGFDVVVIEAQDRLGGRVNSVLSDDWPVPVQLGSWQLGQSADADILTQLSRLGIETTLIGESSIYRSEDAAPTADAAEQDDVEVNTVGLEAISEALSWAAEQSSDVSLQVALDESGATDTASGQTLADLNGAELLGQQLSALAARNGAAASDISSWYGANSANDDSTNAPVIVSGELGLLIEDALDGVETFLSTSVVGIAYSDDAVSLRLGTGESLTVDRVVVTVPLGVLQNDVIEFDPLLPFGHRSAIGELGLGTVDNVWLRFEEPFWTTDAAVWNVVGTEYDIIIWYNLQALIGEPILVGVVGGAAALRVAKLSDDELVEAALLSLAPFAGTAT